MKAENVYGNVQNYEKYNKLKLLPFTIRYQFGIYFWQVSVEIYVIQTFIIWRNEQNYDQI